MFERLSCMVVRHVCGKSLNYESTALERYYVQLKRLLSSVFYTVSFPLRIPKFIFFSEQFVDSSLTFQEFQSRLCADSHRFYFNRFKDKPDIERSVSWR